MTVCNQITEINQFQTSLSSGFRIPQITYTTIIVLEASIDLQIEVNMRDQMKWTTNRIEINNWKLWFSIAFVIKVAMALVLAMLKSQGDFQFYFSGGDTINYIEPLENLVKTGTLFTNISSDIFQLRMPGFMPLYLPLRFLFDPETSLTIIVVIQLLLSSISCYLLAVISTRLIPNQKHLAFILTFTLFTFSTYASYFDIYILSESLSTSLCILIIYLFTENLYRSKPILIVGLCLSWLVFLKPYFVPMIGFLAIYIFQQSKELQLKNRLTRVSLLVAPYVVVSILWASWNYQNHGEFIWLQKQRGHWTAIDSPTNPKPQLQEFVRIFGGQYIAWDPKGHVYPFFQEPSKPLPNDLFPDVAFSSNFNRDSLETARYWFYRYVTLEDSATSNKAGEKATAMLYKARQGYLKEHIIDHYIGARLRCFFDFFFQGASYNIPFPPFEKQNLLQKLIKVFYTVLFWIVMTLGAFELLRLLMFRRTPVVWLLAAIPGFLLLLFPIVLLKQEQRYAVAIYVFLIPFAVSFIINLYGRLTSLQKQ